MNFINTKKIIQNNGIIIYEYTPCVVINYDEGDYTENPYAQIMYKNSLKVIIFNQYEERWVPFSITKNVSWQEVKIDIALNEKAKIDTELKNIDKYSFKIYELLSFLKNKNEDPIIEKTIMDYKEKIELSKLNIEKYNKKIIQLQSK